MHACFPCQPSRASSSGNGLAQEHAITSDDALVLDELPGHSVLIVGAGYISVEFSSIYKGLGADVHLMYRKPLPLTGWACALRVS